jgi:hypothetical protein
MEKIRIVELGREGDYAVGVFRHIGESGEVLGEYPFRVLISSVLGKTTEEAEQYALALVNGSLRAEKLERDWAEAQRILAPLLEAA